jgi:hypothetical protein
MEQEGCSAECVLEVRVIVMLLVVGCVEITPEKESKVIKHMFESHKQEMSEIKKGTEALGPKFDRLSDIITDIIND